MSVFDPMATLPVIATGRRGARYVDIETTQDPAFSVVTTTRGLRYVVRTDSIQGGIR